MVERDSVWDELIANGENVVVEAVGLVWPWKDEGPLGLRCANGVGIRGSTVDENEEVEGWEKVRDDGN